MFFIKLFAVLLMAGSTMAATNNTERDLSQLRSLGLPGGDVMYIFTSASCPACADFHQNILPDLIEKYAKSGRAQLLFVDGSDDVSINVSMLARCMPTDKSFEFLTQAFQNQSEWVLQDDAVEKLTKYAIAAGLTRKEVQQCLDNFKLKTTIQDQWANLSSLYNLLYQPAVAVRRGNIVKTYIQGPIKLLF